MDVAIARTQPAYGRQPAAREIEALYLAAIASAKRSIYLESQYFSAQRISEAVERCLAEPDGPEVVVVNPREAEGWLEEEVMGAARALLLGRLRRADRFGRLRFCTPVTAGGADIYVHAKVLVIDDTLLRVGSSNINNRSLGLDTECDLAIEVWPGDPGSPAVRAGILRVRDTLIAEHLGVSREALRATLRATLRVSGGSLVRTLDRMMRRRGTTLVRFEPPAFTEAERELARSHVLDPDHQDAMSEAFIPAFRALTPPRVVAAIVLVAAGAGMVAWRGLRRSGRVRGRT